MLKIASGHGIRIILRLGNAALLRCLPLVVGLAAVAKVLASPLNAQALGLGVLQDLPEGFFRTRTP